MTTVPELDEEQLKQVMDDMPYGLYIVGTRKDGDVNGMMADWVMQVAFTPRLIAVSFENDARSLEFIRASRVFTVNFLAQDDAGMALAARFAQPYLGSKVKGRGYDELTKVHHKLEGIAYSLSESGCPILDEAMAWLDCEVTELLAVGDHTLAIGRVVTGREVRSAEALTSTYTGWNYSG